MNILKYLFKSKYRNQQDQEWDWKREAQLQDSEHGFIDFMTSQAHTEDDLRLGIKILVNSIWQPGSNSFRTFRQRLLSDVYYLLMQCKESTADEKTLLVCVKETAGEHLRDERNQELVGEFCDALMKVMEPQPDEFQQAIESVIKVCERLGDDFAGKRYIEEFYKRVREFCQSAEQKNTLSALPLRERELGLYKPEPVREAHSLLDQLVIRETMPSPSDFLWRYPRYYLRNVSEAISNKKLALPERKACEYVVNRMAGSDTDTKFRLAVRLKPSLRETETGDGIESEIDYAVDAMISNPGQSPWAAPTALSIGNGPPVTVKPLDSLSEDCVAIPWPDTPHRRTVIDIKLAEHQHSSEVMCLSPEKRLPIWELALKREPWQVHVDVQDVGRWSPHNKWILPRDAILEKLENLVQEAPSGSSAHVIYGIPRVGKTTLLRLLKKRLEEHTLDSPGAPPPVCPLSGFATLATIERSDVRLGCIQ